jgi:hypothetical protein
MTETNVSTKGTRHHLFHTFFSYDHSPEQASKFITLINRVAALYLHHQWCRTLVGLLSWLMVPINPWKRLLLLDLETTTKRNGNSRQRRSLRDRIRPLNCPDTDNKLEDEDSDTFEIDFIVKRCHQQKTNLLLSSDGKVTPLAMTPGSKTYKRPKPSRNIWMPKR